MCCSKEEEERFESLGGKGSEQTMLVRKSIKFRFFPHTSSFSRGPFLRQGQRSSHCAICRMACGHHRSPVTGQTIANAGGHQQSFFF